MRKKISVRDRSNWTYNILIYDLEYEKKKNQKIHHSIPKSSSTNTTTSLRPFILYKIESKLHTTHIQIYSYSLNYCSMSLEERAATTKLFQ